MISGRNRRRIQRLNEYCNRVTAQRRASLIGPMTKAVDDDRLPRIKRSHEASTGSPECPSPPRCRALLCSPHGDERRRSRSDNRYGKSEPRSRGTFSEGRRAARRLYADRADRFWRNRFPNSMQGVYRTATRKGRGADSAGPAAKPPSDQKPAAAEQKPAVVEAQAEPCNPEARGAAARPGTAGWQTSG